MSEDHHMAAEPLPKRPRVEESTGIDDTQAQIFEEHQQLLQQAILSQQQQQQQQQHQQQQQQPALAAAVPGVMVHHLPTVPSPEDKRIIEQRMQQIEPAVGGAEDGPSKTKGGWSEEEDAALTAAVSEIGEVNWKLISERVGTRSHVQCLQRWKKVLTPGLIKGQWSGQEDAMLVTLVSEGFKNWGQLAKHMPGRSSKQCRERWCHHLDPSVKKGDYTPEEDSIILDMQQKIGNKVRRVLSSVHFLASGTVSSVCILLP